MPRKQRHTARRIWARLLDEEGAQVAESTVRAFVRATKAELGVQLTPVFIPQTHTPGEEAECDFGEVHVYLRGELTRLAMFVLRLSYSGRLGWLAVTQGLPFARSWIPMRSAPCGCLSQRQDSVA